VCGGWRESKVVAVWKQAIPAAIGAGVIQINVCMDAWLAMWANPWAPSALTYAEHILYLPLGLVSTAMGTVLLPTFSKQYAGNDTAGMKNTLRASLQDMMMVMIPATVGLMVLCSPVVALLYQRGEFDATATERTARALFVYAPGLVMFSIQKIFNPLFYGMRDIRTPMLVSVANVILNVTSNIILILVLPSEWKHVGIAASTVACSAMACVVLARIACRRLDRYSPPVEGCPKGRSPEGGVVSPSLWRGIWSVGFKSLAAAMLMAFAAWGIHEALTGRIKEIFSLGLAMTGAGGVYLVVLCILYPQGAKQIVGGIRRRLGRSERR